MINPKCTDEHNIAVVVWKNWNWCAETEDEREELSRDLAYADIFISRGTGPKDPLALVNLVDAPLNQKLKEQLQWRGMENLLMYIGVCGGSNIAGARMLVGTKQNEERKGIGFFGRNIDVEYNGWTSPTVSISGTIEITDISYALIDTIADKYSAGRLMNNKKHNPSQKEKHAERISQINAYLHTRIRNLMRSAVDVYKCTDSYRLWTIQIRSGECSWIDPPF